jgi:hypothetical protein
LRPIAVLNKPVALLEGPIDVPPIPVAEPNPAGPCKLLPPEASPTRVSASASGQEFDRANKIEREMRETTL